VVRPPIDGQKHPHGPGAASADLPVEAVDIAHRRAFPLPLAFDQEVVTAPEESPVDLLAPLIAAERLQRRDPEEGEEAVKGVLK
jgi:hypothetical protein